MSRCTPDSVCFIELWRPEKKPCETRFGLLESVAANNNNNNNNNNKQQEQEKKDDFPHADAEGG